MKALRGRCATLLLAGTLLLQPLTHSDIVSATSASEQAPLIASTATSTAASMAAASTSTASTSTATPAASTSTATPASTATSTAASMAAASTSTASTSTATSMAAASTSTASTSTASTASTVSIASSEATLSLISETPITAGAMLRKYTWQSTRASGPYMTEANVVVVDLHHPYVELGVMTGRNNQMQTKETVLNMARQNGAVAAVNGDFFHMTIPVSPPMGPIVSNQELIVSPNNPHAWYTFGVSYDKESNRKVPVIDYYTFEGEVIAPDGSTYPIAGVNRAGQWRSGVHSHWDAIHVYTSDWGAIERGDKVNYTPMELLVIDDVIVEITKQGQMLSLLEIPENGYVLHVNRDAVTFTNNHLQVGDHITLDYNLKPLDPNNPYDGNSLDFLIGGHTILVDQGKVAPFSFNVNDVRGTHARTGVGYSEDGRYVYLITIDNSGQSKGFTLEEFQQFMLRIGVWKGMNLDGGGSSTLVSRPLGENQVQLANRTQYGGQRAVANAIGVYTTAPQGTLANMIISGGRTELFLHEQATYELKAYDTYYNPLEISSETTRWQADRGTFTDNVYKATQFGQATIRAMRDNVTTELLVDVIGREQLTSLAINAGPIIVHEPGNSFNLPVVARTKHHSSRTVPAEAIQWEIDGFNGSIEEGVLTVHELPESGYGYVIASYDGLSTIVTVSMSSSKLWADFDQLTYEINHDVYPDEVTGKAWITGGFPDKKADDQVLYITYNFTEGTGNKASYAEFNDPEGVLIEGEPQQMILDLYGDRSGNRLRMEAWDADGVLRRIELDTNVDWFGWETIAVDLAKENLNYPITLKHIYVASPHEGQDDRSKIGQMAIDNIRWEYQAPTPQLPKRDIELTVGSHELTVDGETMSLDQAPILQNGTTLVPIKFVIDAMGGEIDWDGEEQKVTIVGGGNIIELWIGDPEINLNGTKQSVRLAPRILNQRTLVPLRIIAEQLGWTVGWDGETRTITLK